MTHLGVKKTCDHWIGSPNLHQQALKGSRLPPVYLKNGC